jgi:uncharacterized protein (TIGR02284 family)
MNMEHCIDVCNRLLRGERSAVETYQQAISKLPPDMRASELGRIHQEHSNAVSLLERNVLSMGGRPDQESGAWGTFATAVQGTANLLGAQAALESLQTGEKTGLREYEAALEDDEVMPECKDMIRSNLLPFTRQHIETLEHLQKAA